MEHIFPHVRKPLRYIGNEFGSIHKDWSQAQVKFVMCYPDLYELGMSYLGIRILYHLLNKYPDILCERVFAPAIDAEELLKETHTPLLSLESHTPFEKFDCIGFSLQYELTYTNALNILSLAGIPIHSQERSEEDPLIIAGGSCALNPAPISPFFDCLFIGEAEPVLSEFVRLVREWKLRDMRKAELLKELSKLDGIYVPGVSKNAMRVWAQELRDEDFPSIPILPFLEITRDSLVIEIARGCTRGCRFCQAGVVTRPYRERDAGSVLELVENGVKKTGYRDVSLLSLSASDHSQFLEIVKGIRKLGLNVSLPSLLGNQPTPELAKLIGRGGLTLAPETGTDRLRAKINKPITESEVLNSCEFAAQHKFTHLKLYYMLGLPGEKDEDIDGIVDLTLRISKIMRGRRINVTLSPFVPRPHTPFQWEVQEPPEELLRKINYIKSRLRKGNIKIKYRDPLMTLIEGICARGDAKISQVIEEAWKEGAKFDGWSPDGFDFSHWERALHRLGVDPHTYLASKPVGAHLPWDSIDVRVKNEFFIQEQEKQVPTLDCRITGCYDCGVCAVPNPVPICRDTPPTAGQRAPTMPTHGMSYGRFKRRKVPSKLKLRFRVMFEKTEPLRWLGHLDLVRAITRAIVRTNIPISYSEGFTKRPKISFSPPLPFGVTSREEYFDILLESPPTIDIKLLLNQTLPSGLQVLEVNPIRKDTPSLSEKLKRCEYRVADIDVQEEKIQEFMLKQEVLLHHMNIRPAVLDIEKEETCHGVSLHMQIGKVKPWWVLEFLLGILEAEALDFKVERTKYL